MVGKTYVSLVDYLTWSTRRAPQRKQPRLRGSIILSLCDCRGQLHLRTPYGKEVVEFEAGARTLFAQRRGHLSSQDLYITSTRQRGRPRYLLANHLIRMRCFGGKPLSPLGEGGGMEKHTAHGLADYLSLAPEVPLALGSGATRCGWVTLGTAWRRKSLYHLRLDGSTSRTWAETCSWLIEHGALRHKLGRWKLFLGTL